jgi:nucleotide-binding universal stress UspA family protein
VIVGVHPGQSMVVLAEAAQLAVELGRPLVCAYVTDDSYLTEWDRPGDVREESLHPADADADDESVAAGLAVAIEDTLASLPQTPESWTLRILNGDPAKALGRLAEEADGRLIVVGTHRRGFAHTVENWLAGSVGARLAHDQSRAVVVVPVPAKDSSR